MVAHFCATIGSTFCFARLGPLGVLAGKTCISVLIEWGLDYITILRINSYFTINYEI